MNRLLVIVVGLVLLAIALGASLYLQERIRSKPELILELPVSQCKKLSFGIYLRIARGRDVDDICKSHGFPQGLYFALKGRRAIRFDKEVLGWYGDIIYEQADPDTVYFYRYDERYRNIVWEP